MANIYEDNYELVEALALLVKYGNTISLRRSDVSNMWTCSAIVDGRPVEGVDREPHRAANIAWAMCFEHVTYAELLMGTGKKPVSIEKVFAAAPDRAKRARLLLGHLPLVVRFKSFLGRLRSRIGRKRQ